MIKIDLYWLFVDIIFYFNMETVTQLFQELLDIYT